MSVIAIKDGHIEIFNEIGTIEHEEEDGWQIGDHSLVSADYIIVFPGSFPLLGR